MSMLRQFRRWMMWLCLSLITAAHATGIYKWTDAEGNVHYGEQAPPQGGQEMHLHTRQGESRDDTPTVLKKNTDLKSQRDKMIRAMQGDRLARQAKQQRQKQQKDKQKRQCARAKDTLRRYRRASSLYKLDAEGRRQQLPVAIKQQRINQLQAQIKKHCQ